jgi:hypothetical protein
VNQLTESRILLASALLLLASPPLVFVLVALTSGMSPADTAGALVAQYAAPRVNLAVCSGLGLVPLLLLAVLLWIRRRRRPSAEGPPLYAIGGALPILAVAVFVNAESWTAFLPNRSFLGFPHGLEFIIGPGIFAPIGMLAGLAVVAVMRRIRS